MKINIIIIVTKLFEFENKFDNEKKIYDENILIKVKTICYEIVFFVKKFFKKFFSK